MAVDWLGGFWLNHRNRVTKQKCIPLGITIALVEGNTTDRDHRSFSLHRFDNHGRQNWVVENGERRMMRWTFFMSFLFVTSAYAGGAERPNCKLATHTLFKSGLKKVIVDEIHVSSWRECKNEALDRQDNGENPEVERKNVTYGYRGDRSDEMEDEPSRTPARSLASELGEELSIDSQSWDIAIRPRTR